MIHRLVFQNAKRYFKVGEVFVNTMGWEEIYTEFYRVTKVQPRSIKIKQLQLIQLEITGITSRNVIPSDQFLSDAKEISLRIGVGGKISQPASYYRLRKWDGTPQHDSWYE